MSNAAASYMPEMQVMTLKPEFEAFCDPDRPVGFTNPEQVAMFVHEWMHYLHNVSTVLGLTTFCTLTIVWSNFRRTFDGDGWSLGAAYIEPGEAHDIERQYGHMAVLRGKQSNTLPSEAVLDQVRFIRVTSRPVGVNREGELQLRQLVCEVEYKRCADQPPDPHQLVVGTHDILEGAAYLLEERAAMAMGTVPVRPPFDPYFLLIGIARLLAPGLDSEVILKAALASLQYPDPPQVLPQLLACGENALSEGQEPGEAIRLEGVRLLEAGWPSAESSLRLLEEMFPLDEPMGRAVMQTVSRLRANLTLRRRNLFFELDIVQRLRTDITALNEAIRQHGAPTLIQQRRGDEGQIGRDLMYALCHQDASVEALSEGWRLMHAAFRFMGTHLRTGSLRPTAEASASQCPFFTTCADDHRRAHAEQCRRQPWLAAASASSHCDYAVAVRITRPPASEVMGTACQGRSG